MSSIHWFNGANNNYSWEGILPKEYGAFGLTSVVKHVLIGPEDAAPNFVIRYFRIEPGGHSRLESHPHDHGVVILHGQAKVQLGNDFFDLNPLDVVYVEGNQLHQFTTIGNEPLGFICVIKRSPEVEP